MKKIEVVARSQEQARRKAAAKLGLPYEQLHVIEEYEPDEIDLKGLTAEEAGLAEEERGTGEPVLYVVEHSVLENLGPVQEWLAGLVDRFQPGATVELMQSGDGVRAVVDGPDPSIFIGRQGHTLAALQHLISRVVPRLVENCPPVHLDVGDYRDRKIETLERLADQVVARARRAGKPMALKPMPSPDRKFLHNYLKSQNGVSTQSHGREPFRYLVVATEGVKIDESNVPPPPEDSGDRGDDRGDRGGRRRGGQGGRRGRGGRAGQQGRSGGDPRRQGGQPHRRGGEDPYAEERRRLREIAATFENDEEFQAAEERAFRDFHLEESPSRMMAYNENAANPANLEPGNALVDEIE
jgi:spoIIIJ-associated protein